MNKQADRFHPGERDCCFSTAISSGCPWWKWVWYSPDGQNDPIGGGFRLKMPPLRPFCAQVGLSIHYFLHRDKL